jgi:hypothetical protein
MLWKRRFANIPTSGSEFTNDGKSITLTFTPNTRHEETGAGLKKMAKPNWVGFAAFYA